MLEASSKESADQFEGEPVVLSFGVGFSYQLGLDDSEGHAKRHERDPGALSETNGGEERCHAEDPSVRQTLQGSTTKTNVVCASVRLTPTPVPLAKYLQKGDEPAAIAAGSSHSVLLTTKGKLYRWGLDDGEIFRVPEILLTGVPLQCVAISCGRKHTMALMKGGVVMTWGTGYFGQLGHGDNASYRHPKVLRRLDPQRLRDPVEQVACGGYHSVALTLSGRVFSWGFNRYGQCGVGSKENTISEPLPTKLDRISEDGMGTVTHVVCGRHHSALITSRGGLYTWGGSSFGKLGLPNPEKVVHTPMEVPFFRTTPVLDVDTGDFHMVALTRQGSVYSWGYGTEGQGGHGGLLHMRTPRKVEALNGIPMAQVVCGPWWSMAVTVDGFCYSWGCADGGWTGLERPGVLLRAEPGPAIDSLEETKSFDSGHNVLLPKMVCSLVPYVVKSLACGSGHTLALAIPRLMSSRTDPVDGEDAGQVRGPHAGPGPPGSGSLEDPNLGQGGSGLGFGQDPGLYLNSKWSSGVDSNPGHCQVGTSLFASRLP
ncbi:unnamed protein product [Choristocarpus tenellus]